MIRTPPSLFTSSLSASSSGFGGRRPPSYQVRLTGGIWPRAGNLKKVCVAFGNETLLKGVQTVSMLVGNPNLSAQSETSKRCAPMSPIGPQPQSTQPRQLNG